METQTETDYEIIKQAKPQFPVRELLMVPHEAGKLTVSYPAFGPSTYRDNLQRMNETYSHPSTGERISFRPATTSKSISAVTSGFGMEGEYDAKREIFDPRWLQTGYIVRTQEGVFTNTTETDESRLKQLLNNTEKVNGIYLTNKGIAFAPYETFETGVQDCDTFAQGGLARALEHTPEKTAKNLREIASPKHYKRGVNVWGFDNVKEPVLRVAGLDSLRYFVGRLNVGGDWGGSDSGYVFGVLKDTGEASRAEK